MYKSWFTTNLHKSFTCNAINAFPCNRPTLPRELKIICTQSPICIYAYVTSEKSCVISCAPYVWLYLVYTYLHYILYILHLYEPWEQRKNYVTHSDSCNNINGTDASWYNAYYLTEYRVTSGAFHTRMNKMVNIREVHWHFRSLATQL